MLRYKSQHRQNCGCSHPSVLSRWERALALIRRDHPGSFSNSDWNWNRLYRSRGTVRLDTLEPTCQCQLVTSSTLEDVGVFVSAGATSIGTTDTFFFPSSRSAEGSLSPLGSGGRSSVSEIAGVSGANFGSDTARAAMVVLTAMRTPMKDRQMSAR